MIRIKTLVAKPWLALLLGLATVSCDWTTPKMPGVDQRSAKEKLATARRLTRACGSAETYDRLKALTFDEAMKSGTGSQRVLDALAANATLRMESPVAKSRDNELDITTCAGHLVLDLPPGVQDRMSGAHRLEADVEYSAQQAADGSGLVYAIKGAEPIVDRLAALTLPSDGARVAAVPTTVAIPARVAEAVPIAPRHVAPVIVADVRTPATVRVPPPVRPEPVLLPVSVANRSSVVARPSFSCATVTSRVLHMVCADSGLAARDRGMSSAFYAALANGDPETQAALRASRDRFLSFRQHCPDSACVAQAYDDRIAEIRDIAQGR